MRRLIAITGVLAAATGLTLVAAGSASANITAPGNGSVLRGNATLADSGGQDNSWFYCGGSPSTTIQLINSSGSVVFSQGWSGSGSQSVVIDTHGYPNGSYRVHGIDVDKVKSGFASLGCGTSTHTSDSNVTIQNITNIAYTGATSGPTNTGVTVSASLTDPNKAPDSVAGKTITFSLGGGGSVNGITNSNGIATATLAVTGAPRSTTVTAAYAGDTSYVGKSVQTAFTVTKDASITTVVPPADVVHGQPTSFTAHVGAAEGSGVPGGTVQFRVDGNDLGAAATLDATGTAVSPSTSTLSTTDHTVTAVYGGDGTFKPSTSAGVTQHVGTAATTTTLADDPTSTVSGQAVTFTATVAVPPPGAGAPTGSVQFDVDGQPYGTAVQLTGDHASLTISNLHAGNRHIDATYNGDGDFSSSSSATLTHGVNRADTSVELTTSAPAPVSGQPLTYSAHVRPVGPGAGTLTGTVQFAVDGTAVGGPVEIDSSGNATSPSTSLLVGTHHVTADYSGDGDFAGGSDAFDQVVAAAHTSTALTTSPNPSVFGQPITLHAEVTPVAPATGHPAGAVKFTVDGNTVGTFVDLDHGVAETTVDTLAPGPHEVRAAYYSNDENFVGGTSDVVSQTVNKAATRTTLDSSASPSVFGQPVTFTAKVAVVAPGAGQPSGTITFSDGPTVLGTADVSSSTGEQASITVANLSVATHAVTASYSGDDDFTTSSGATTQVVQRAQTSTVVTSSANPAQSGQGVRFTATVSPVAPGAGDPSGTVTFTVNGARLGSAVDVVNGVATSSSFASLSPGTYAIAASYSGDRSFVASTGGLDQGNGQNVTKGATTLSLETDGSPSAYGDAVAFTATVTAVAPATGHPSGVVQFWEGSQLLGATGLSDAGAGTSRTTFVSSTLKPGSHPVTARYVGNFNFDGSSASVVQAVGAAPTVTGLTASANPITFGDSVTLTATVGESLPAPGDPSGTVTFKEGDTVLGTADLASVDGARQASVTVDGWTPGDHVVRAVYGGDGGFAGSTSAGYTETVVRAASSLTADTLIAKDDTTLHIKVGIVRATLTGLGGAPLGGRTVTFTTTRPDGAVMPVCTATTDSHGVASCVSEVTATVNTLLTNGYDAAFAGDAGYLPATDHGRQL